MTTKKTTKKTAPRTKKTAPKTTNPKGLSERAMIVRLSISQWTARKLDRKISKEVAEAHKSDESWGRYNKLLIAEDAIKKIQKVSGKARNHSAELTLPWDDAGGRILPASLYLKYSEVMRGYKTEFETQVNALIDAYPTLKSEAKKMLNGMFREEDYPTQAELVDKYRFTISVTPLPDAKDFRVDLNKNDLEKVKKEISSQGRSAIQDAMNKLHNRVYCAVKNVAETLKQNDKIFRDSLVGNVQELVDLLPHLNLTGDKKLADLHKDLKGSLVTNTPDDLRKDQNKRQETAKKAAEILAKMGGSK